MLIYHPRPSGKILRRTLRDIAKDERATIKAKL
jgi:acyl-coenzyme A synthetase/AMP-(fatty) acid ligase